MTDPTTKITVTVAVASNGRGDAVRLYNGGARSDQFPGEDGIAVTLESGDISTRVLLAFDQSGALTIQCGGQEVRFLAWVPPQTWLPPHAFIDSRESV